MTKATQESLAYMLSRETKAGTWRVQIDPMEDASYWFALRLTLSYLSHASQAYLPRDGMAPNGLTSLTSVIDQEHLTEVLTGPFSQKQFPLLRLITKINHHKPITCQLGT